MEVENSRIWIGLNTSLGEVPKIRFQLCMISKDDNFLLYVRASQGHTGGKLIVRELLGHVAIPYNWKEFIVHNGSSIDCISILKSDLVAGGRISKDGATNSFLRTIQSDI